MKTTIRVVGIMITLPFIILETMIKVVMYILYFPLAICVAILYPLLKDTDVIEFLNSWWKYANKWKRGFYSGYINRLWKVED